MKKLKRIVKFIRKHRSSIVFVLLVAVWFYAMVANFSETNHENNKIELLQAEIIALESTIAEQEETIEEMTSSFASQLNERNWTDHWTKELLIKLVDNNHQAYYIRNEIMYYNKNMSKAEACYQALWIYSWSIENNVHPYLTTAVFVQESRLRHIGQSGNVTTSHAGARGIGQLMPIVERIYQVDATVFEENVKGTTLFLQDLQNMYDGCLDGMLGHYNGGSRPYEKIIDYEETKNFVAVVSHIYETMLEKY